MTDEHDCASRAVSEAAAEDLRGHAEPSSVMREEFLAIMSHELRHPLNLIAINAGLLSRLPEVRQSPAAQRAVSVITHAVASQAKIIEDLLDMSRLSTGKLTLVRADVDLGTIAAQLLDVLKSDPLVDSLRLQFVQPATPLMVNADAQRLEQVVLNLLSNAVKFTPAGGTIALSLSAEAGQARLDVSDTGAGIDPCFLPTIFDMFGQGGASTVRSKSGLGIGLALVRHIIALHGGRVAACSAGIGQGSRFSLWLPLVQCEGAGKEKLDVLSGATLPGCRILLVDDMADSADMFRTLLELEGARVSSAASGKEALAMLAAGPVDIVISDISMPDMNGCEFMRAVRAQPALATVPAIAASGLGREKDVQLALDAGFSDYIVKPVDIDFLCQRIKRLVRP